MRKVFELTAPKPIRIKTAEYIPYGSGDEYPFLLSDLYQDSHTLATCIELKSKFIAGNGIPQINDLLVNNSQTYFDLISDTAFQLSLFNGFCWLIGAGYSETLQHKPIIKSYPFEFFRFLDNEQNKAVLLHITNENKIDVFKVCNIVNSIEAWQEKLNEFLEGGGLIQDFFVVYVDMIKPSQAYIYPRASYQAIIKDAFTEAEIKRAKLRDVKTGFSARIVATMYGTTEPTQEQIVNDLEALKQFTGSEGATFMLQYALNKESKPDFDVINPLNLDKLYEYTEKSVSEIIMRAFQIPQALYGIPTAGKLGDVQEMQNSIKYVQSILVRTEQKKIANACSIFTQNNSLQIQNIYFE